MLSKAGVNREYIHGRKCIIEEISSDLAKSFFNATHIQGYSPGNKYICLKYNNDIVACMTFSKPREEDRKNNGYMILSRFSSKGRINGAANKLLRYYIKQYKPTGIISYSNNMYSDGKLYNTLGFKMAVDRRPDYKYVEKEQITIKHKTNFSTSKLGIPEREFTENNNYLRLYDCGTKTWILDIENNIK
jgi:hypothetical protein